MEKILIIDDDDAIRRTMELHLADKGFRVFCGDSLRSGKDLWNRHNPEIVLLDLKLPDGEGTSLLKEQMEAGSEAIVLMITGHQDMEYAIHAMKHGAFNYLHKPLNIDELDLSLEDAVRELRVSRKTIAINQHENEFNAGRIAGVSASILNTHKQIGMAAKSKVNVLISGESGTGKELVARAIHYNSTPDEPFVAVNCSAIVSQLMESEMFGHEKGAFTGAVDRKLGKCEYAGHGTLFLDEIGDLSMELQAKLLRVLQERCFERVGGTAQIPFLARVIAATHQHLESLTGTREFREDLYFRLNVFQINLLPLRERKEDILPLVEHLLEKINLDLHRKVNKVPEPVVKRLMNYSWPGNVRELENVLTQAVVRSTGDTLSVDFLEPASHPTGAKRELQALAEVEKEHIKWVLGQVGGNLGKACEVLGITRPTLRKKMEDYSIS
ncbi:sigma-54-dependent Fis family transcriptional regulator [bacterium]|nr:sigma-54-dependent Fis family transcriptional regulator [bacterium]